MIGKDGIFIFTHQSENFQENCSYSVTVDIPAVQLSSVFITLYL